MSRHKNVVHLRLPRNLLDELAKVAAEQDATLSHVVRSILIQELDEFDLTETYERVDSTAITFVAKESFRRKASQAALVSGASMNTLYVQLLSRGLGVLPCRVVVEAEDEEQE